MSSLSRRHFLTVVAGAAATAATLQACSSNNNNGDPVGFGDVTAGKVSDLAVDTVMSVSGAPAFVGRDANGLYAMTSTCTHQGCDMSAPGTVITGSIVCGCHRSRFDLNGAVLVGPASAPLVHFAVSVAADGTITVHGNSRVADTERTAVA